VVTDRAEQELLRDRAMLVRKLKALPIEAVVRGYLIGSGWKDYQKTGAVAGLNCRRACSSPISCRSRCSRPPPRRPRASTMKTFPSRKSPNCWGTGWRNR